MNGNPNKKQRDWHDWCRGLGCYICESNNPSIHHIKGSKMKLKGCVKPGEWYVIPLCYDHHQGRNGIHQHKTEWVEDYGAEKFLWASLVIQYEYEKGKMPMSKEEYLIILDRG